MSTKRAILFSLVSWMLLALCYPPFPLGPLALAVLAPWFYVLRTATKRGALVASYLGAFLFNIISMYWLYHVGEVAPPALIFSGLFLGVAFLSLFTLLCAWVFIKIKDTPLLFLFPFFWAGIEVSRSKGDMSFPWLSLGLVFGNSIELMQAFALIGVFGCSVLIIASNMCLVAKKFVFVPVVLAVGIYIYGAIAYKEEGPASDTVTVAVVQPSIPQTEKWSREYFDSIMTHTWNLFETLDPSGVQLILFPETAIPANIHTNRKEYDFLASYAEENNTVIVMGALSRAWSASLKKKYVYNSVFLFGFGEPVAEYSKIHLVPFSERIPFKNILPLINYVDLGGGDFSPGDSLVVWQPGNFSPLICYEAIYGSLLREAKRKGAKFVTNHTNDGWFKRSIAPYQHLNLVRSHAVENGIGVVRAANTGISAFIGPNGRIIEQTELFEEKIIVQNMPLEPIFTLYSVVGDYIEWVLFVFSLGMIVVAKIKRVPNRPVGDS